MRAISWHAWIPGTLKLDSITSLLKCDWALIQLFVCFIFGVGFLKCDMETCQEPALKLGIHLTCVLGSPFTFSTLVGAQKAPQKERQLNQSLHTISALAIRHEQYWIFEGIVDEKNPSMWNKASLEILSDLPPVPSSSFAAKKNKSIGCTSSFS